MNPPLLTLDNLACGYHQQAVVKDLSLELAAGEIEIHPSLQSNRQRR